ncbi:hypothetical protein TPELB_09650 [Terrisporobacter petrolearius]|uniref:Glycosyltransferase sugar-binding region containing DXD motif-containing protein n=1 Tax=Terrisporobacter petrolearius TaxID=1460447 RepID=A0ABZ3FAA9_9FIRM
MIPKVIHYCWFGHNEKPELVKKCIESWEKYLPDYQIKEWNEDNFDINLCKYTRQAYDEGKWAFVSDVARLWIVYNEGGVYLDTDVELHNTLYELCNYSCWFGCDDIRYINTGLGFGAEKGQWLVGKILYDYYNKQFDKTICNVHNTKVIENELASFKRDGRTKVIKDILFVGMLEYGKYITHYECNSWKIEEEKNFSKKRSGKHWNLKCKLRNPNLINFLERNGETKISKVYIFIAYDLLDCGLLYFFSKVFRKIIKKV